ncbi:MAG: hypothetical protein MJD61_01635, partial [Proteobacteria bacterium]|nr:hypothetical protein [Pseudomonadota bacterium]
MSRRWLLALLAAVALTAVAGLLVWRFPEALAGRDQRIDLVQGVLLLVLVGSSGVLYRGVSLGRAVRNGAIWVVILLALVAGYSYRHDLEGVWRRVSGNLVPHAPVAGADGSVVITAGRHGHFVVEAEADGTPVRFLVDT